MAEPRSNDPVITHLGVSLWVRLSFAALAAALVWMVTVLTVPSQGTVHLEIAVALAVALATLAFVIAGSPAIRLGPDTMEFRTLERTTVMLWTDVQSIGVEKSKAGTRTVVRTTAGSWRCARTLNAPGTWPIMGTQMQADALRAAWFRSGGYGDRPPITRPWGPDPASFDTATLGRVGRQRFLPSNVWMRGLVAIIFPTVQAVTDGHWAAATFVAPIGLAMVWLSRRRVVLSPAGLEIHRFRTTFVPWSAVTWISRWNTPQGRSSLRLFTLIGMINLPAPFDDALAGDPAFERKFEFIQRCWETHRGATWVAPAPPRAWRPPPPRASF